MTRSLSSVGCRARKTSAWPPASRALTMGYLPMVRGGGGPAPGRVGGERRRPALGRPGRVPSAPARGPGGSWRNGPVAACRNACRRSSTSARNRCNRRPHSGHVSRWLCSASGTGSRTVRASRSWSAGQASSGIAQFLQVIRTLYGTAARTRRAVTRTAVACMPNSSATSPLDRPSKTYCSKQAPGSGLHPAPDPLQHEIEHALVMGADPLRLRLVAGPPFPEGILRLRLPPLFVAPVSDGVAGHLPQPGAEASAGGVELELP